MTDNKNILLLIPPYYEYIYGSAVMKSVTSRSYMVLSLGILAAHLRKANHNVMILDLNLFDNTDKKLSDTLRGFKPQIAGISSTSPIFWLACKYAETIKQHSREIVTVIGGVHPTIFPSASLENNQFDIAVVGEGEESIVQIAGGVPLETIKGIAYKTGSKINVTPARTKYIDLNTSPIPAYDLYEVAKYIHPKAVAKNSPVTSMETSRGCFGQCSFCNMRKTPFRFKTYERILEEIEYVLSLGYREIHFLDDNIAANPKRAKELCSAIIKRGLKFSWQPRGGVRVDSVDLELFKLMKQSGAWTVPFGIESGNQDILDLNMKNIKLEQVRKAVSWAKEAGLRTEGYFMIGLMGETEATIKDSIEFSKSLDLDLAKFAITIPLPGTPMFDEWDKQGLIKTKDWSKYIFSTSPSKIFSHPNLSKEMIDTYYYKSHRDFYFRPKYILKSIIASFKNGDVIDNIKTFFKTKWY